ncbi:MAG: TerB family tellurite resistance protein [Gemmatimonadetes bacterium]|nr:TerB family tellurite resistance protein [Gemmatimonadota bacterium]
MPSLLFPTGSVPREAGRGTFNCPACRGSNPYTRVVVGRVLRIFAIQFPAGVYGEYVECGACLSTYRPSALAFTSQEEREGITAEYERALRRLLALLVISDGDIHDAEIRMLQRVFSAVTGSQLTRAEVLAEVKDAAENPTSAARYLGEVVGLLNDRGKEQILRGAAMVVGSDGHVHDAEADLVRRLGAVMQLDDDRVAYVMRSFT